MRRVLAEFDRNGFVPEKVLDYGSGNGSAFCWAGYERWGLKKKFRCFLNLFLGDKIREYSLIDPDLSIRHFSMDLCALNCWGSFCIRDGRTSLFF